MSWFAWFCGQGDCQCTTSGTHPPHRGCTLLGGPFGSQTECTNFINSQPSCQQQTYAYLCDLGLAGICGSHSNQVCSCQPGSTPPPGCTKIGGPFASNDACLKFLANSASCPHCVPPVNKKITGRLSGYDESAPGVGDVRPVFETECCQAPMDIGVKGIARLMAADEGDPGSGDIRAVLGTDMQCFRDHKPGVKHRGRLIGADEGWQGSGDIRPVIGLFPACVPNGCCMCSGSEYGGPGSFNGGHRCQVSDTLCFTPAGSDTGHAPVSLYRVAGVEGGAPTLPPGCNVSQYWTAPGCAWQGKFTSVLGFDVWLLLVEDCTSGSNPPKCADWVLHFFWPCPGGGGCGTCGSPLMAHYSLFTGPWDNVSKCPPGLLIAIRWNILTFPPHTCCSGLPGVYWDGDITENSPLHSTNVTDGCNTCCPTPDPNCPNPKPYYWWACTVNGVCGTYQTGCPQNSSAGVGPFCNQTYAQLYCNGTFPAPIQVYY